METRNRSSQTRVFLFILAIFAALVAVRFFDGEINAQDTTIYAFNYGYGFISRGLMGSILCLLDSLTAADLMNYETIYAISIAGTAGFFVSLFAFYRALLKTCDANKYRLMQLLIVAVSIYAFPEFVSYENFGRVDVFLAILMLIGMTTLVTEKAEWLIVPLCIVGMLLHQGFIFMNINILLVGLFYKMLLGEEAKSRRYYGILFAVTLTVCSALFIYFEFFSHVNGTDIYDTVKAMARQLSADGRQYAPGIINHEILGEGVFMDEWPYHVINYAETAEFVILFLPYIVIAWRFCRNLVRSAGDMRHRLAYLAIALGAWTVIPEMVLKIDYGRYVYEIVFYYLAVVMMVMTFEKTKEAGVVVEGDDVTVETGVTAGVRGIVDYAREHYLTAAFLIAYPMVMMPFLDVLIANNISMNLVDWLELAPPMTW